MYPGPNVEIRGARDPNCGRQHESILTNMKRRRSPLSGSRPHSRPHSTTDLWTISLVATAALLVRPIDATAPVVHTGIGTAFTISDLSTASCGLMSWPSTARTNYAAVTTTSPPPTTFLSSSDSACGRCARVWCTGLRCGSRNAHTIVHIVGDECEDCGHSGRGGNLNLSPSAFHKITGTTGGSVSVRWQFVDCPVAPAADKSVSMCLKRESTPEWLALQPVNDTLGVNVIRVDGRLARLDRASPTLYYILADPWGRSDVRSMKIELSTRSNRAFRKHVTLLPGHCVAITRRDEVMRGKTAYASLGVSGSGSASGSGSEMAGTGDAELSLGDSEEVVTSPTPSTFEPIEASRSPAVSDGATTRTPSDVSPTRQPNPIDNDTNPVELHLIPITAVTRWVPSDLSELTSNSTTASSNSAQPRSTPSSLSILPTSSDVSLSGSPSLSTVPVSLIITRRPERPSTSSSSPLSSRPSTSTPTSRTSNSPSPPAVSIPNANDKTTSRPTMPPRDKPGVSIPDPTMNSPNGDSTPHPLTPTPTPPRKNIDDTSPPPKPTRPPGFSNESSDSVLTSPLFIGLLLGTVGVVGAVVAYRAKVHQQHLMNRLPLTAPVTAAAAVVTTSRAPFSSASPLAAGVL